MSGPRFAGQIGAITSLGLGMYEDEGKQLHIDIPELLHVAGYADTPQNRDCAIRVVSDHLKKKHPTIPLVLAQQRCVN